MRDLLISTPATVVEADIAALQATISRSPALLSSEEPDAVVYWSHLDLAPLNVISDAHIAPEDVPHRVPALLAPFLQRGRPFLWLTTPDSTTPQLEAALAQAGFRARELPAMHAPLRTPVDPYTPDDVYIDLSWPDHVTHITSTLFNGLGFPGDPTDHHLRLLEGMDSTTNQFFIARSLTDGEPLGAGTMHARGTSVMLANISILPGPRERGIARALVATMMNRAVSTGATSATVLARHGAYQLYIDLGFRTQFELVTWCWTPRP